MISLLAIAAVQAISSAQIARAEAESPIVRASFNRQMLDYPTARFRDVHVTVNLAVDEPRGVYFCGWVNGKNRMGAYIGWQRFMASGSGPDMVHIKSPEGASVADMLIDMTCGDLGVHVSDTTDRSAWLMHR